MGPIRNAVIVLRVPGVAPRQGCVEGGLVDEDPVVALPSRIIRCNRRRYFRLRPCDACHRGLIF